MNVVIAELLPLALVVAVSPLNVLPVILLLFTRRPLAAASSFLAGFVVGVAVLLVAAVVVARTVDVAPGAGTSTAVAVGKLVLGVLLVVLAVRKFRHRPREGEPGAMPRWMDGIAASGPGKAAATGVTLGAGNPKNVAVGVATGITIASAGLSAGQQVAAGALYVVVASLGVTAPIVAALLLGDRSHEVLEGWRSWLDRNNAVVLSVLFLVFGIVLIIQAATAR